jgi:hypothetical protein
VQEDRDSFERPCTGKPGLPDIAGAGTQFCSRLGHARACDSSLRTPSSNLGIATMAANATALGIEFVVCSYTW